MKINNVKPLFSFLLLLILVVATGCTQGTDQAAKSSSNQPADGKVQQQKDDVLGQASDDQPKSNVEEVQQHPTDSSEGDSDEGEEQVAVAGVPANSAQSSDQKIANQQTTDQQTTDQQMTDQQTTDQQTTDQESTDQESTDQQATDQETTDQETPTYQPAKKDAPPAEPTIEIPTTWKRLSKKQEIWIDTKNKQVIVGGKICLDAGPLEMLICPPNTKEHESIIVVNAASWQVDAALQAIGATKGEPCRWDPEYAPAWGAKIDTQIMWRDEKTKKVKTADGKQWILNVDTQKPMTAELVFGGSRTEAEFEGEKARYLGDDGELICLANFATSTIDLHVTKANTDIFFEANTELIPPINTQVYTIITPGPVIGKPDE